MAAISSSSPPTTVSPICLVNSFLEQRTSSKYTDTLKLGCSPAGYQRVRAAFPSLRLSYFYPLQLLIITVPGMSHEVISGEVESGIQQDLHDCGFYWPGWRRKKVLATGSTDHPINDGPGEVGKKKKKKGSVLQPDSGVGIKGLEYPFLVIEVADTQSSEKVRTKAEMYLKGGDVRFVVIVDMVRSKGANRKEETLMKGAKRPAEPDAEKKGKKKKVEVGEGEAAAGSASGALNVDAETIPTLPLYAQVRVSVLSSTLASPREVVTLVSPTEVWPASPPPGSELSFTWEDMGMEGYPEVLRGHVIKVGWMWLHEFLVEYFQVEEAGSVPIRVHQSSVWKEEAEKEAEEDEGSGEDETEAERQSGSDGSYHPSQ